MTIEELIKKLQFIAIQEQTKSIPVKINHPWAKEPIDKVEVKDGIVIIYPYYD